MKLILNVIKLRNCVYKALALPQRRLAPQGPKLVAPGLQRRSRKLAGRGKLLK